MLFLSPSSAPLNPPVLEHALRWRVEGIWRGPAGQGHDVRHFSGSRRHVERVLARLEGKGRLVQRLSLQPV